MRLVALLLICACEKGSSSTVSTGSDPQPPGPNRFEVELPRAVRGDEVVSLLRVSVSATEVFVNGEHQLTYSSSAGEWESKMITERLAKALPAPSAANTKVIVAADKRVAYGVVIAVLDGIRQRGYSAIALESAP